MGLTVYGFGISQPSRSVYLFCKAANIPYMEKNVDLFKAKNKDPEYLAINPFGRVPCIDDDGFSLAESASILEYLACKYKVPGHWYPLDLKVRAKIDEYLHWQHTSLRKVGVAIYHDMVIYPKLQGKPMDEEQLAKDLKTFDDVLGVIEKVFLGDNDFLCAKEVNIADICAMTELMQVISVQRTDLLASHPKLKAWKDRVQKRLNPAFDEVHQFIIEFSADVLKK